MSVTRNSLGVCTDPNVVKVFNSYRKGLIKAGQEVIIEGKKYSSGATTTSTKVKNSLGEVSKSYRLHNDGNWYLHDRSVSNNRGKYGRRVNTLLGSTNEFVSLGGHKEFLKQANGTYIQRTNGNLPPKVVSEAEIEAAIDYVKGKGSVENYTKLVRNY